MEAYIKQSNYSSPGKWIETYKDLPDDLKSLIGVVQNILIHQFWFQDKTNYGITPEDFWKAKRNPNEEINLLTAEDILTRYFKNNEESFLVVRKPLDRVVGNCRDFSLLLVSFLRYKGIAARVRSGVATYFVEDHYEDHFICEYFHIDENRWVKVDPQLDDLMINACGIKFDTLDISSDYFIFAAESLKLADKNDNHGKFGIFNFSGEKYLRYKLFSDLMDLTCEEILPWEAWGIADHISSDTLTDLELLALKDLQDNLLNPDYETLKLLKETDSNYKKREKYKPFYLELPFLRNSL